LRYAADVERLKQPAAIAGTITTPWRVVMIGADLNALVNCDIVNHVSPPPDKQLFSVGIKTDWLKPGRAVWKYLDGGENTLDEVKNFSQLPGNWVLNIKSSKASGRVGVKRKCAKRWISRRQQKVGLLFWKHSRDLRTPEARKQFLQSLSAHRCSWRED
jgi:alpha-glucosidase